MENVTSYAPRESYHCPWGCGWTRSWSTRTELLDQIIDHPIYGEIMQRDLIDLDIRLHNCRTYAIAVNKYRRAFNDREAKRRAKSSRPASGDREESRKVHPA